MQTIYKPELYPAQLQNELTKATPLAIEIANRWILGWPQAVKELIQTGEYLAALENQEQQEREALSQPGICHLARHEIIQEFGLSLSPPTMNMNESIEVYCSACDHLFYQSPDKLEDLPNNQEGCKRGCYCPKCRDWCCADRAPDQKQEPVEEDGHSPS